MAIPAAVVATAGVHVDAAVAVVLECLDGVFGFILVEDAIEGDGCVGRSEGGGVDSFVAPAFLLDLHSWLVVDGLNAVAAAAADESLFWGGRHGWSAEGCRSEELLSFCGWSVLCWLLEAPLVQGLVG